MIGSRLNEKICEKIKGGKRLTEIARELGVSYVYIKKLVRNLVDNGVLIHNPPYSVHSKYKEMLNNEKG